eukprot:1156989-Amphidinium_carterae.3
MCLALFPTPSLDIIPLSALLSQRTRNHPTSTCRSRQRLRRQSATMIPFTIAQWHNWLSGAQLMNDVSNSSRKQTSCALRVLLHPVWSESTSITMSLLMDASTEW